jgi:predicted kinase
VILRSDEVRKRLWGRPPPDRLPPEAYTEAESVRVYCRMLEEARLALRAGRAVVLDAVFQKPAERDAAEALAVETGVPFDGVWLEAPPELMAERLRARSGDASDADEHVLEAQLRRDPGEVRWRRVSSG